MFFGCRGVAGFNGCCWGVRSGDGGFMLACISGCRGVIGFNVATWPCSVREKVHPTRPDGGCEREKVRPASPKWAKNAVFRRVGRVISRKCRWRGRAGRIFSRLLALRPGVRSLKRPPRRKWGFARHGAVVRRVADVSDPRVVQFSRRTVPHPFCGRIGVPSCVDGCPHLVAALQESHRFAGVFAAYPASFVPPDARRNPGPRRVDHLHHHTPITLSDHPTTRAANQLVA